MELLERYLAAVRRHLPQAQQDDIIAELSDSIQSRYEERETQLGRPLNLDEESAILKSYGRPLIVASRYQTHQHLVGPQWFPFYLQTLKWALAVMLSVDATVAFITGLVTGNAIESLARFWGMIWGTTFLIIGVVTVVFAALEYFGSSQRLNDKWNPRTLPAVIAHDWVPRSTSIADLVFYLLVGLSLIDVPGVRYGLGYLLWLGPGVNYLHKLPFNLTSVWHQLVIALFTVCVIHVVVDCLNLYRPHWKRLRAGALAAASLCFLIAIVITLQAQPFVVAAEGVKHVTQYQEAARDLNQWVFWSLIVWSLFCGVSVMVNLRGLVLAAQTERTKSARSALRTPNV